MSGLRFLSFLVAAAINVNPRSFCNLCRNSGVSSFISVIVVWFTVATIPSVISWWLVSSCVASGCVLAIVGGSSIGARSSWLAML